jgi:hypothetical protein
MWLTLRPQRVMNGCATATMMEAGVAGTLTISITQPDTRAMRALGYPLMWTAALEGRVLGWGHSRRRADAETEALDFVSDVLSPDQVADIAIIAG